MNRKTLQYVYQNVSLFILSLYIPFLKKIIEFIYRFVAFKGGYFTDEAASTGADSRIANF